MANNKIEARPKGVNGTAFQMTNEITACVGRQWDICKRFNVLKGASNKLVIIFYLRVHVPRSTWFCL